MVHGYKELLVWQKGMEVVIAVYQLTERFPKSEVYGLVSQMRRAAVSIVSNIAEGRSRGTRKDFRNFLITAYGSSAELETQLEITRRLSFVDTSLLVKTNQRLDEVMRMLNSMIVKLKLEAVS